MVKDQVHQLAENAADGSGRVMALALHPALWSTTSDAIADHYPAVTGQAGASDPRA